MVSESSSKIIAYHLLDKGQFRINFEEPFEWTTGYRMPIYSGREYLADPELRRTIAEHFRSVIYEKQIEPDYLMGIATAGIPPANALADMLGKPFGYVHEKKHGLKGDMVGPDNFQKKTVIVLDDNVSTGRTLIRSVYAIRGRNGIVNNALALYSYDFPETRQAFELAECELDPLLTYDTLIEAMVERGELKSKDVQRLEEWRADPFNWGEKHGFPRRRQR